jgi:hypothetical protein
MPRKSISKCVRSGPLAVAMLVSCIALLQAPAAEASTVTVGPTLPLQTSSEGWLRCLPSCTLTDDWVSTGSSYRSPIDGVIVRWRVYGTDSSSSPGVKASYRLRILTPSEDGTADPVESVFTGAGSSETETPEFGGLSTFPANLHVQAGQMIGIDLLNNSSNIAFDNSSTAVSLSWLPTIEDGQTRVAGKKSDGHALAFNADVQPLPTLSSFSPSSGSIEGGYPVTLTGSDFSGATAVSFGDTPAIFTAKSDTEIVATAPPTSTPRTVGITVETIAGVTSPTTTNQFTYIACTVPKLKGRSLKSAKGRLRSADCKPGRVKKLPGTKAKRGRVVGQYPKPGSVLPPGAAVNITLKKHP